MTLRYFLPSYLSYKYHKRAIKKTKDLAKIADHKVKIKQLREVLFLHDAAQGNIAKLLSSKKYAINFFVTDNNGNNALHLAALNNQKESIPFLLELGLDPRSKNFKDQSPISIASSHNFGGALYYLQEAQSTQTIFVAGEKLNGKDKDKDKNKDKTLTELTLFEIPPLRIK